MRQLRPAWVELQGRWPRRSQSWINPTYTTAAVAGLQGIKLVVNILRDGFAGLVKQTTAGAETAAARQRRGGPAMLDGLMLFGARSAAGLTSVNGKRRFRALRTPDRKAAHLSSS